MKIVSWIDISGLFLIMSFSVFGSEKTLSAKAEKISYRGWKDAYLIKNEQVEAVIVPAVGRMMSFRLTRGENIFLVKENRCGYLSSTTQASYASLGGLYTWIAPQTQWVRPARQKYDFLDLTLDFGPYTVIRNCDNQLTMISPVSETYGLQIEKKFVLVRDNPHLEYTVTLYNVGSKPVRWSLWNLIGVRPTGIIYFQTLGGFTDFNFLLNSNPEEHRRCYADVLKVTGEKIGIVDLRKYRAKGAKVGVRVGSPYLAYHQPGSWLIRSFEADTSALFTDQQSQIEFWADALSENYYELEVLSPDFLILPGKSVSWQENMYLFQDDTTLFSDPEIGIRKLYNILKDGIQVDSKSSKK